MCVPVKSHTIHPTCWHWCVNVGLTTQWCIIHFLYHLLILISKQTILVHRPFLKLHQCIIMTYTWADIQWSYWSRILDCWDRHTIKRVYAININQDSTIQWSSVYNTGDKLTLRLVVIKAPVYNSSHQSHPKLFFTFEAIVCAASGLVGRPSGCLICRWDFVVRIDIISCSQFVVTYPTYPTRL